MQVPVVGQPRVDLRAINDNGVCAPVMPVFEDRTEAPPIEAAAAGEAECALAAQIGDSPALKQSPLMWIADINAVLDGAAHCCSLLLLLAAAALV